ncbi:MAG: hypothetical protein ABIA21_00585 [Candidatus Aenigmatarchaeota archaeon]
MTSKKDSNDNSDTMREIAQMMNERYLYGIRAQYRQLLDQGTFVKPEDFVEKNCGNYSQEDREYLLDMFKSYFEDVNGNVSYPTTEQELKAKLRKHDLEIKILESEETYDFLSNPRNRTEYSMKSYLFRTYSDISDVFNYEEFEKILKGLRFRAFIYDNRGMMSQAFHDGAVETGDEHYLRFEKLVEKLSEEDSQ